MSRFLLKMPTLVRLRPVVLSNSTSRMKYQISNQPLEPKFEKVLELYQKQIELLESKNQKLEEKLIAGVLQRTESGVLDGKIEQFKDKFAKMHSDQQKQMMAQLEVPYLHLGIKGGKTINKIILRAQNNCLEQKLKEAEQRAHMETNKFADIIYTNQQKMEKFQKEMEGKGKRAIESNQLKLELDHIWGQLMIKSKKLENPKGIAWNGLKTAAIISEFGLKATNTNDTGYQYVFATEGYALSGDQCRKDNCPSPGTIAFYYEVTASDWLLSAGFSDGNASELDSKNLYAIKRYNSNNNDYICYNNYWISGRHHKFVTGPAKAVPGDVVGSGLLLNSKNEWAVFFTLNGLLFGRLAQINPTVDRLYPTICIDAGNSVVANFGHNLVAKPFKFESDKFFALVSE